LPQGPVHTTGWQRLAGRIGIIGMRNRMVYENFRVIQPEAIRKTFARAKHGDQVEVPDTS
jgi:hypothetical protein